MSSGYADFAELFDKKAADTLLRHEEWDHMIPLEERKSSPYGPMHSFTPTELEVLQRKLDQNLARDFIQLSTSPVGAFILFVKKKDGDLRLCVDYRDLNKITIRNRYSLPLILELIDRLQGVEYFTKLDLRGAYNLVRIVEGKEWKTAVRTRFGHYEWKVMPFGLTNAPASFQALINDSLRPYLDRFAYACLDDRVVFSRTKEEHTRYVRKVLRRLQKRQLYIKLENCQFYKKKIKFLGFILGRRYIEIDPSKIKSIRTWPSPRALKHLQAFLGFCNFYRRFIRNYSQKAVRMIKLLKKGIMFQWNEGAKWSFQTLKNVFTIEGGVLQHFRLGVEAVVETYISDDAIGRPFRKRTRKGT